MYGLVNQALEDFVRRGFGDAAWNRVRESAGLRDDMFVSMDSYPDAIAIIVDAVCFRPFPSLGGKSLHEVLPYARKEQQIVEEAAGRLAAGTDPGIIPERLVIGAARVALDRRLARPGVITRNFYTALSRS